MTKKTKNNYLESCKESLDDLIRNRGHVKFLDRAKNFGKNVKNNARKFAFLLALVPSVYAFNDVGSKYINWQNKLEGYNSAYEYVVNLNELQEISSNNNLEFEIDSEKIQIPETIIENSKHLIHTTKANEVLDFINQNRSDLLNGNLEKYDILEDQLNILSQDSESTLANFGLLLWFSSMAVYGLVSLVSAGFNYKYDNPYKDTIKFGRTLKSRKKKILDSLNNNPELGQNYEIILDKIKNSYIANENLVAFIDNYLDISQPKNPIFDVISKNSEFFYEKFEIKKSKDFFEKLVSEKITNPYVKSNPGEIFIKLIQSGWNKEVSYNLIKDVSTLENNFSEIFAKYLQANSVSEEVFLKTLDITKNRLEDIIDDSTKESSSQDLLHAIKYSFEKDNAFFIENFLKNNTFDDDYTTHLKNNNSDATYIKKIAQLSYMYDHNFHSMNDSLSSFVRSLKYNFDKKDKKEHYVLLDSMLDLYEKNPIGAKNLLLCGFNENEDYKSKIKIFEHGFIATPYLLDQLKNTTDVTSKLNDWKKKYDENSSGNFFMEDELSLNLEYTRYWNNFLATRRSNYEKPEPFCAFKNFPQVKNG